MVRGAIVIMSVKRVRRCRGRPKWRLMDVERYDMKLVRVREEDAEDRFKWRQMIWWGDPLKGNN